MSHELRTPLNAIIGFSSLLAEQTGAFNERSGEYLHEINDSGVRLLNLINDILEITQMDTEETGSAQLVYLSDIVDTVMIKMQLQAGEAGVCLQNNLGEPLPALRGDARRLQRAVLHLVSNAIKFTERGGWARIAAHSGPDGLAVEVSDNGVGMPPGAEAKILAPFSQYDSSLARTREGVGLGLTFVRRVADHHDAVLQIFSELGNGTRVVMNFPADRVVKVQEVA
jgi:signal transduction histidine kinase